MPVMHKSDNHLTGWRASFMACHRGLSSTVIDKVQMTVSNEAEQYLDATANPIDQRLWAKSELYYLNEFWSEGIRDLCERETPR